MIKLYNEISKRIKKIQFNTLWKEFIPFDFALYNNKEVCLNGQVFIWDNRFIGNTAIKYKDKYIAIWNVESSFVEDYDVLASKIIHEMFHAFQKAKNETRFPQPIMGLNYRYLIDNLNIKHEENEILVTLYNDFKIDLFNKLLSIRKYRQKYFPVEFEY